MAGKQATKPLSFKAIWAMRSGDKDKADIGENRGLRVSCGVSGVKSYTSPITGKLMQIKIGQLSADLPCYRSP